MCYNIDMEKENKQSDINIYGLSGNYMQIELLITRYCTYNCEHCMYNCGTHESKEYMSDEILAKVKKQVDFLKKINIHVCVNLIGGEPTINFDKFSHVFKEVETWNTPVSMTTNGWWLSSRKNIERFFETVAPYVNKDGKSHWEYGDNSGLTIRISVDPFHDKKRKTKDIQEALNNIFSDYDLLLKYNVPIPYPTDPWLWKQINIIDGEDRYYIAPNGRGKNVSNIKEWMNKYSKDGNFCMYNFNRIENIHYEPDGHITDTCGFGSMYDFGTVDDNVVYILELIWQYKKDRWQNKDNQKFGCWNCREMVQEWKNRNFEKYKQHFSSLNTMDMEKWLVSITER